MTLSLTKKYKSGKINNIKPKNIYNKAKAISAELLELNLKNKLKETGENKMKREETEILEEKNTENQKKLHDTERNRMKQEET